MTAAETERLNVPLLALSGWENPVDVLSQIGCLLAGLADLLQASKEETINRDCFATLLGLLHDIQTNGGELSDKASGALRAVSDLVVPENDLHIVSRAELADLIGLVYQLHMDALLGLTRIAGANREARA